MPERVFGYSACSECPAMVLNEIAWKSGGRCAECFRKATNAWFDELIAVTPTGERIPVRLHRSKRTRGERLRRKKARTRSPSTKDRARLTMLAQTRAKSRLARLMPEIYEIMLADERAKLDLNAWTIERALTAHRLDESTYRLLDAYHLRDTEQ